MSKLFYHCLEVIISAGVTYLPPGSFPEPLLSFIRNYPRVKTGAYNTYEQEIVLATAKVDIGLLQHLILRGTVRKYSAVKILLSKGTPGEDIKKIIEETPDFDSDRRATCECRKGLEKDLIKSAHHEIKLKSNFCMVRQYTKGEIKNMKTLGGDNRAVHREILNGFLRPRWDVFARKQVVLRSKRKDSNPALRGPQPPISAESAGLDSYSELNF